MAKEYILPEGKTVRVEQNAQVLGLVDEKNPYWYKILRPDGTIEEVNVSRLRWFSDDIKATIDFDGCIQIYTSKLTAQGAINLFHWLRTNLPQLEAAAATISPTNTTSGMVSPESSRSTR